MTFYCLFGLESRFIYDYSSEYYDVEDSCIELSSDPDLDEDLCILRVYSPYCANDPYFLDYLKECVLKCKILK